MKMKRHIITIVLALITVMTASAQRKTDQLDRGLVALPNNNGIYLSWRIQPEEYYNVTYNVYRNGTKINSTPLLVSNYTDAGGSTSSSYTIKAVKNGVEQTECTAVIPWTTYEYDSQWKRNNYYKQIPVADVYDRNGTLVFCACGNHTVSDDLAQSYGVNDISLGDVDGDGQIDFILKRTNDTDRDALFPTDNTTAFCRIEIYASSINFGLLWWIDCGPNTVYGPDEQWDAVAYDWDQDGRCEIVYRAYGNTIIHKADGSTITIGSPNENIRNYVSHTANMSFTNCGTEWLLYINGLTGQPYVTMEYPLKRLESSEFSTEIDWSNPNSDDVTAYINKVDAVWGDGYGHRSSKYFVGAPYLDGRNPSLYLGRGIYTRHKMIAYDIDPATHALTERWQWSCLDSSSPWFGNGNHNFSIGDVDEDGRDEIIYGSMVIDDNGKGLHTTGFGHGDALHNGDLDPFRKGQEIFACLEEYPYWGNNFRNATTGEVYYKYSTPTVGGKSGDDGRCMAANLTNEYPGCIGASSKDGVIALSADTVKVLTEIPNNWSPGSGTPSPSALNFRIYWDGDLLEETLNGPGANNAGNPMYVNKMGNRILQTVNTLSNNGTKKNPCAQGDIFGDWREELVLRAADNKSFYIYTTNTPTNYRIPSLWNDHQYRQAMVWQTFGYNQPPHTSFFLGDLEGITVAPPPYTNTGRTEIHSGSTISSVNNNTHVMICDAGSYDIDASGASPEVLTVNVPSVVSGNDDNYAITYSYSTTQLGTSANGDLTGATTLAKQGDGMLKMAERNYSYSGNTNVWAGSLAFSGTLPNSEVWMNRHTNLYTAGTFNQPVTMEYGSKLYICKDNATGDDTLPEAEYTSANFKTLNLHEGARVAFNVNKSLKKYDVLNVENLNLRTQDWQYGPKYLSPVFEVNNANSKITVGTYPLCKADNINGDISDIVIESATGFANNTIRTLENVDGVIYLNVSYENELYIGSKYNISSIWTEFSPSYTIAKGETYNFKFVNYGGKKQNQNWILAAVNGDGHSTADRADYAEYISLLADGTALAPGHSAEAYNVTVNKDWTDMEEFITDMEEADVDVTVSYSNDNVLNVSAVMTATDGHTYNYTAQYTECTADDMTLFFTVDHSHMTYPEATHTEKGPDVKMTYVDYNNADTSYGEVTTARSGYNTAGTAVGFGNTTWNCNWITYLQVDLSEYKDVNNVTLKFKGSGSTDSKRNTQWGVGYNTSTWSSDMTYNTADKSITLLGDAVWGSTKSSTTYEDYTFDISDAYFSDNDKVLTIIIYELAAAGGYVTSPEVIVNSSIENEMESDEPTEKVIDSKLLFSQDFEDASTIDEYWTSPQDDRYFSAQTALEDGTHYCRYNGGSTNGTTFTYSALNNVGEAYTTTSTYSLDFDFAVIPTDGKSSSGAQTATFTIFDKDNSSLCHWQVTTEAKTAAANSTGTFYLGNTETGTFTANVDPYWYHINISASSDGTVMTVTDIEGNTSAQYTLSDHLIYIGKWTYATGKQYGGLCLDDITLTANAWLDLTLSPTVAPDYAEGIYQTVKVDRNFNIGYSTLCLPFNMSVETFTGGDTDAYVAYLSDVQESNGVTSLYFVNMQMIEANKPCIIYLSKPLDAPTFSNIAVHSPKSMTFTGGAWSMYGNYTPGFSMYGKYGVVNNAADHIANIMKGGAASTLNAYGAYLVGPANAANAKIMFGEYVEEEEYTGISGISSETTTQSNGKYAGNQQIIILHNGKKYRINGTLIK